MTIQASIDLGTNTCLLLVMEGEQVLGDFAKVVRLGEGVDQHRLLQQAPMERTLSCLRNYSAQLRKLGGDPARAVCVATSQARDARNSSDFFSQIQKETGFQFKVLSGEEEARATFVGSLLPGLTPDKTWVIDIGGGSTEIISLNHAQSVDLGSVRFTERFFKSTLASPDAVVKDEEFWACQEAIDQALREFRVPAHAQDTGFVAVAGTATTLAAWYLNLEKFDSKKVDGLVLTRGDLHRMVEELKWRTVSERSKLPGMEPLRADVLLAGCMILWRSLEVLGFSQCQVSTRGLRYGVIKTGSPTK